ncbi:UDP-glucuronosyl/UDP-glucosyltransferase [Cinara cedri]|uniref:UDP-glucuronosyltransferase n=1 Tax=Cinara cedri TaxID=506608 RepID=A0A5E4N1S6_9HEMI|nr:UDP-glucuronosyl/UDP-glucosyltransferase [Cinara cedri]
MYVNKVTVMVYAIVSQCVIPAENARILAVETVAGKSHWNFMSAVLRSLTEAGHSVTVFTQFPDGDRENYTEVDTSMNFPILVDYSLVELLEKFEPVRLMSMWGWLSRQYCDMIYKSDRLGEIVNGTGNSSFDLIIIEPISGFDCMSYLASALDLPMVYVIPSPMVTLGERKFTGHASNPACVSNIISNQAVPKTFAQRFINTVKIVFNVNAKLYNLAVRLTNPSPYDFSPTVSPSIIFQNSHFVSEKAKPVTSNVINIGGIHLKPAKPIPKDILDFIGDAPHGVIYVNFGSLVKLSALPDYIEKAFKEALAQVPQKVLLKYEEVMKDKPKNVMISNWFPQRDILLHPNVKLFISHGGMSSVYETVDAGVPVLGFPLIYDQSRNIDHLVYYEMAISMDILTVTNDTLLNNILEIINNEKYTINAKKNSQIFKDRPMSPAKSVVYWTEYVIRHKGAPHLKYHGLNLTWYQYYLLDVIAVILVFVFLVLYIVYKSIQLIIKLFSTHTYKNKVKYQ